MKFRFYEIKKSLCIVAPSHTGVDDGGDEGHATGTDRHPKRPAKTICASHRPFNAGVKFFRRFDGEDYDANTHDQN